MPAAGKQEERRFKAKQQTPSRRCCAFKSWSSGRGGLFASLDTFDAKWRVS